jgi:predicted transcriptional regulator/RimJ/RimL family protein N-acetyltransferase
MKSVTQRPILILSIRREHAENIFSHKKLFELRKVLPRTRFSRVYLHETGGAGIVGWFNSGKVIRKPLSQLWASVRTRATTRSRFFKYFSGWQSGCAIEVVRPRRFAAPFSPEELRVEVPQFTAPMSYLLVAPTHRLFRILEDRRKDEEYVRTVRLRRIKRGEHKMYETLVLKEIAPKYDDITHGFAESILKCHTQGSDPNGMFTLRKEVLAITQEKRLLGFTTVTYKMGGSAKTGPTILFPRFRSKGFGLAARRALADRLREVGVRKLYCTCPDTDHLVIKYLLSSGYSIEGHFRAHYTSRNGELVFGHFLERGNGIEFKMVKRSKRAAYGLTLTRDRVVTLAKFLSNTFTATWVRLPLAAAKAIIVKALMPGSKRYEDKAVHLAWVGHGSACLALVLMIPKRGGAVKGLCFSKTKHLPSLHRLLKLAELDAVARGRRKLYFLHPVLDDFVVRALKTRGYISEGLLLEPYQPGKDVVVLSKFLR